jgi:hypothetical protein
MRVTRAIITFMPVKPDIPNHCICFMLPKNPAMNNAPCQEWNLCRAAPSLLEASQ